MKNETDELDTEKVFNDSELEDIMSEIENLEQDLNEFSEDDQNVEEAPEAKREDYVEKQEEIRVGAGEIDDQLTDALGIKENKKAKKEELRVDKVPVGKTKMQTEIDSEVEELLVHKNSKNNLPKEKEKIEMKKDLEKENVVPITEFKMPASDSQMNIEVSGQMQFRFNFKVNNQSVQIYLQQGNFIIEMPGGIKFSVPTEAEPSNKMKKVG